MLALRITGWLDVEDEDLDFDLDFADMDDDSPGVSIAAGTVVQAECSVFDVTIHYLDPGGADESTAKQWNLEVSTRSAEEARRCALRDFRLLESLSSGRWQRKIIELGVRVVRPAEASPLSKSPALS